MNDKGILKLRYEICNLSPQHRKTERIWNDNLLNYSLKIYNEVELEIMKKEVYVDELKNTIKFIDKQSEIWFCIYNRYSACGKILIINTL